LFFSPWSSFRLVGHVGDELGLGEVPFLRLAQHAPHVVVAQRAQDGGQVGHELVEGGRLEGTALVVTGPHAVQDGMAGLVRDDVVREAGVDALLLGWATVLP